LMRHRLSAIIGGAPGFELVGVARNGDDCLNQLPSIRPDVVTLDVEMPGLDGLATLDRLMRQHPTRVLMVSSLTEAAAQTTLDSLALGAVDYLPKPTSVSSSPGSPFSVDLLGKLSIVGRARLPQYARPAPARAPDRSAQRPAPTAHWN